MTNEDIKQMILTGIPEAEVDVQGDDGVHFQATVVSSSFEGQSRVRQHQQVYATLGDSMQAAIHALSLQTFTPEQWQKKQGMNVL